MILLTMSTDYWQEKFRGKASLKQTGHGRPGYGFNMALSAIDKRLEAG